MIRTIKLSDSYEISIIEKENFKWFFRRKKETIEKMISNKKYEIYVSENSWIEWYIFLELSNWFLYIENISVNKKFQWKWIWKKLMIKAEEVAERIWYKALVLDVLKNNNAAISLYEKFWYKLYKKWKSQIKMFKKLT